MMAQVAVERNDKSVGRGVPAERAIASVDRDFADLRASLILKNIHSFTL